MSTDFTGSGRLIVFAPTFTGDFKVGLELFGVAECAAPTAVRTKDPEALSFAHQQLVMPNFTRMSIRWRNFLMHLSTRVGLAGA